MQLDLLTPPKGHDYAAPAAEQAHGFVDAFAQAGLSLRPRPWTEAGDAPAIALLAWGYHEEPERWLALLDSWPTNMPLFNPAPLMRWNTRKTYLGELEAAGAPAVPTWFGDANPVSVAAAFEAFGTDELIVKPQVSAGSHQTYRLKRSDRAPVLLTAMIQPFLPAIQSEGEYSLFYIGSHLSHAIRKRATGDDFRIQPQFGGQNSAWQPDSEALAVAQAALRAAPDGAIYARIDLLRRLDGKLALIEFEAIEPDLYPDHGHRVLDKLAEAVAAQI